MSITWTKNGSGQYLVESAQHLLQIMNQGSLYTDTGDAPTIYWESDYLQTVDIDLEESTNITPIGKVGITGNVFEGEYDGGLFQIKNWSYTGSGTYIGLFGYSNRAVLKRIRLSGVWTIGDGDYMGFLCGYAVYATIVDIEADFDDGTTMGSNFSYRGSLLGMTYKGGCHWVTLRGFVNFATAASTSDFCGGIIGIMSQTDAEGTNLRNLATFPNGISGEYAGGITGSTTGFVTLLTCLNGMHGDINAEYAGGIIGAVGYGGLYESLTNSMTGGISSSSSYAGGIFGLLKMRNAFNCSATRCLNYMNGDIASTSVSGGIIGQLGTQSWTGTSCTISKCIVAMQGNVDHAVRGSQTFTPDQLETTVDASFGMTYSHNDVGSTTMVVDNALVYDTGFTDLPYIDMSGTDSDGNSHNWDFVYANIGGKYPEYSHLSVHTAEVSAPFHTDFGLGDSNSVVYLTYANLEENSLYINSNLGIVETAASVAYNYAKSAVLYDARLAWTKNGSGQYLVESKEHLLQIMNQGSLYTDMGDHPTDYWASSYLQTSDIDLVNDHANIEPIGYSTSFNGEYDGGLFQIKNWSYTKSGTKVALFGYLSRAVLKRIRLSGVWTMGDGGSSASMGFLCGYANETTTVDIEADFDDGTTMGSNFSYRGGLFGYINKGGCQWVTLRGFVNFATGASGYCGGIVGIMSNTETECTNLRNLATFPQGISANTVGGICANTTGFTTLSNCLNGMHGDIDGIWSAGGIIGAVSYGGSYESLTNSMKGGISSSSSYAGGIFGYFRMQANYDLSATRCLNYMNGDIMSTTSFSGGMIGLLTTYQATGTETCTISKCIVAMQGNVGHAVIGSQTFTPDQLETTVVTSFGMTYSHNDVGSTTMVVDNALVYDPGFTDLPYIDMTGTDPDGNSHAWDFVYANIGGKYPKYSHLSVHTAEVSAPFYTDFGLGDNNNVVYLTYANLEEKSLYINSNLSIVETAAEVAFDHAKSSIMYGTPDPPNTLVWTKNGSGQYLVESKEHLLQIMNQGSLYTDMGDHPTDYWASSYLQTSDIDLVNDHASIEPIGNDTTYFSGEYDGGRFQIKNWSYTGSGTRVGLFGYSSQAVFKRIRLSGVWTMGDGDASSAMGFLCGYAIYATTVDIEADFDDGTTMGSNFKYRGGLLGYMTKGGCHGVTLRGFVNFAAAASTSDFCGGIVGIMSQTDTEGTNLRNLATFPNGISGKYAGGITGNTTGFVTLLTCLNGMHGDIHAMFAGGIIGYLGYGGLFESLTNSMTGGISSSSSYAGGIFGYLGMQGNFDLSATRCLNYMNGDIMSTSVSGGIIGQLGKVNWTGTCTISKCIVAMQGNVDHAVRGSQTFTPDQLETTVDTSFGMVYSQNDVGSATMVVDNALVYDTGFTDLPYIDMTGTDPDGNSHAWDFVYANIGGKYPKYSHLSVHTAEVSAPFYTDFGLADTNNVVYLTYANLEEKSLYINSNLSIVETAAEMAFDHAKSSIMYGTPDPPITLLWTKNGSGQYLVESKEHLLQIMNQGSLYTDLGDHPTDYWASSFLQTSDIDLVNDHASIEPIGISGNNFTGEYDGGLFQIKNWSYTGTLENSGLFGDCSGCVLKRIRVAGVWTMTFTQGNGGFVCGKCVESTIYDVAGNFSEGTLFSSQIHNATGVLFGLVNDSTAHGLSVLGSVNFGSTCDGFFVGGVLGNCNRVTLSHARNLASFPNGMYAKYAGGVAGQVWEDITTSNLLNAMDGDITGLECGGVIGRCGRECYLESVVNTMTGNIGNPATNFAGGVVGYVYNHESEWLTATRTLNYMRGDITGGVSSGGIMGHLLQPEADTVITKSIVAMQGNVEQSVIGSADFTPSQIEVTVDTSFGMFFDTNDYGTATMVVDNALVYEPGFTDLPYIDLTGTDPDGNSYAWDFVYANIGGKYPKYTHLSAHTAQVSAPFHTDFGLTDTNNVVYLAYANLEEKSLYIDPSLTIVETVAEVEVAFDHAKSSIMYGTPTPATTVLWTKDADDKFEVATKQHLLQLMNKGALYTDLGDRPTDSTTYWTHHYVQTAEIDFAGDIADVVHIGDETTTFLGSYEENGFEVLNWRGPGIGEDESLFGAYTTLEWTVNAEGQHEVATAEHLVQIMQRGLLYLDEGNFPADYWGASAAYIQTADIDLIEWHAKILPIGNAATNFYGQYDGGGHAISNWAYTQPEDSATVWASGLFGAVVNAEIKSVSLQGVWTLSGSAHASTYLGDGFLCGSATASTVYDIGSKFSAGSMMSGGSSTTAPVTHRVGCLIGMASDSVVCNVTLGGTVDMKNFGADGHNNYVGGVIGYVLNAGSTVTLCRNVAIFPNGITGNTVGGLLGYFHTGSLKHCINAMQGDVVGITHAGGVCGLHVNGGSCEGLANSMTGNIQATENAGGIHGCVDASLTASYCQLMNYMSGNVAATNSGGVVGLIKRSVETGDVSVTNSIVAMHGTVDQPIHGSASFSPSALDAVVNTEFGMVYEKQIVRETTLQDFTTNPAFADLPYIPLVATDPDGISQTFDFVFASLGGNFVYSGLFTHLSLHTTAVSAPLATDYGLDSSNAQVYLTYANLTKSEIFVDDTLTVAETAASIAYNHAKSAVLLGTASLPLICQPRAVAIKANIDAAGSQFQLTYQATAPQGSREIVAYDNFSEAVKIITGLSPETTYVVRLYADEALAGHVLVRTSENVAENYVVSDFFVGDLYDISSVADKVSGAVVNELFTTGDVVEVDMGFARKTTKETVFVKKGETIEVEKSGAVLLPFETNGETQESTIKLSDTTSVQVGLDQASGDISVGGNLYKSGKSFVIDGRKCTVFDI